MASLGNDLAKIRKEQNLSVEEIHDTTKIPTHIIRAIEDDSIFSNFEENATYIRSYVRSIAKVLSIKERDIIYALNKQEKGAYSGSLIKDAANQQEQPLAFEEEAVAQSKEQESEVEEEQESEVSQEDTSEDEVKDKPEGKPETVVREEISAQPPGNAPDVRSVDWVDMGRRFQPLQATKSKLWVGAVVIVLLAAAGVAYYFYFSQSNSDTAANTEEQSSSTVTSDSLQLNIVPPADDDTLKLEDGVQENDQTVPSETFTSLPDTLSIVVYAAYGKLEPVRVYTDIMNSINPYWIEQGSAVNFNFVNDIRIRGQFSRIILLMNGHVIQNFREQFYNPATRLVEIHRSFFKGDPKWMRPAPDSLGIDAPPPSVIKERPTFN